MRTGPRINILLMLLLAVSLWLRIVVVESVDRFGRGNSALVVRTEGANFGRRRGPLIVRIWRNAQFLGGCRCHRHIRCRDLDLRIAALLDRRLAYDLGQWRMSGSPVGLQKFGQVIARVLEAVLVKDNVKHVRIGL